MPQIPMDRERRKKRYPFDKMQHASKTQQSRWLGFEYNSFLWTIFGKEMLSMTGELLRVIETSDVFKPY